jgi:hypothetical protein
LQGHGCCAEREPAAVVSTFERRLEVAQAAVFDRVLPPAWVDRSGDDARAK